ncbi:hypothetical protein LWM68_08125 [Niabella sp. W65]|nr:hypothetical protein [Niabella sp. W65]MCH7362733.1 hypothetical protein [Niabella sp. W65]ULT38687.1 hypothetical protein KRR40_26790 [Niabella sp. I65]
MVADRGEPDSKMFAAKGLCYFITDAKGNKVGVPIKASAIYSKPTLSSLEEKFVKNAEQRWRFKTPLKNAIDKAITGVKDADRLVAALKADNIDVVFRRNPERIYGVTFVDHRSMSVFNGSDLGKITVPLICWHASKRRIKTSIAKSKKIKSCLKKRLEK